MHCKNNAIVALMSWTTSVTIYDRSVLPEDLQIYLVVIESCYLLIKSSIL